jgi:5'-methylthioadenosine phosphorylase
MLAVIGGSGLSTLENLDVTRRQVLRTPYGEPSSPAIFGRVEGKEIVFIARHGIGHTLSPHEINYRANLWALKDLGVEEVIAVNSVGGIGSDAYPGALIVPDQLIDYTSGRAHTFYEGFEQPVVHIDFTWPFSDTVRQSLLQAAADVHIEVQRGGVYAATNGPRLETAAEIRRLENDGATLVGMTGMPEAALARELGLPYAMITVVANWAAGKGDSAEEIRLDDIAEILSGGLEKVKRIIARRAACWAC